MSTTGADPVELSLRHQLLNARNGVGGWGYEAGRTPRLEPTCWALLALRTSHPGDDRILTEWPLRGGALLEHRTGLPNWSFHALALATRLALSDVAVDELQRLADALVEARGIALEQPSDQRQNNRLQGWSWIDGTFSWAEPTAWAILALKKCYALGIVPKGACTRILEGESLLQDRVCAGGGWNYGNSNVFNKSLPAYIPTTAIALLALQDRGDEAFVQESLTFLEEQSVRHPSTRALALSTLALRRHGRPTSLVEGALRTWLSNHPAQDVPSLGMALCALEKPAFHDAFTY